MLLEKIQSDLKEAMKAHDEKRVGTLRLLTSALKNERISKMGDLSEQDELAVIAKQAKQRRDSIQQFTDGGRADLAETETAELAIIETYLPAQMGEAEIEQAARKKMAELGVTDASGVGKLMGALMGELKGRADGALVKTVVGKLFAK